MDVPLSIVVSIVGICVSVAAGLIIVNLRSIRECLRNLTTRTDKQDERIDLLADKMTVCKVDCDRNTVSKEDWVRSEGYTRKELKELTAAMNRMTGHLAVMEKIPQVVGAVVKEVVSQMRHPGDINE